MSEIRDIQKRIARRRYGEPPKKHHFFTFFYRTLMLVMGIGVVALAFLVNDKIGLVEIPQDLKNINFGLVSEWIPFEDWFSNGKDDQSVNAAPSYTLLKDNQYTNGTNQANLILDGVVLHVENGDAGKNSVTLRHDNGVIATYGHLNTVSVKQDERLLKGAVVGSFDGYLALTLVKDQKTIDLNTALQP